jgi:putative transcriptional regulator
MKSATPTRRPRKRKSIEAPEKNLADRILEGLEEILDCIEKGEPMEKRFTVRTVTIPDPRPFDARAVKRLRTRMGMSQEVFARIVGVSRKLVEAWEAGTRIPAPIACRLLDAMDRDPTLFFERVEKKAG